MSALDALTPDELAEVEQAVHLRRLERSLVDRGMWEIIRQDLIRFVVLPNPATGAEWTTGPPSGATWELLAVSASLLTSATVATRIQNVLVLDNDGNFVARWDPSNGQAASLTNRYSFTAGLGISSNQGANMASLPSPPFVIPSGYTIKSATSALDSGDQYQGVVLTVREWSPVRLVNVCRANLADLDSAGGIRYLT